MREILVAVDDSEASERVSDFVNDFFVGLDVTITAVNVGTLAVAQPYPALPGAVYPWPYLPSVPPVGVPAAGAPHAELARDAAEETLDSSGLQASDHVAEVGADVADTLRRVASERDVDLIVVGATHKGTLERLFSPSVGGELARSAPRPVLVVH